MKIPNGMTEDEVTKLILKIANRHAAKYVFGAYELEDIVQEAFIIGSAGLEKYDGVRSLETFLYIHINNRLKNFKRQHYYRQELGSSAQLQQNKKNIIDAPSIESFKDIDVERSDFVEDIQKEEILTKIDEKLSSKFRKDYLKMMGGFRISSKRAQKVIHEIKVILGIINEET